MCGPPYDEHLDTQIALYIVSQFHSVSPSESMAHDDLVRTQAWSVQVSSEIPIAIMVKMLRKIGVKKTLKMKKRGGAKLVGIKQGVGAVTKSAFPKPQARRKAAAKKANLRQVLNAMNPAHLPLPRAVGAYTVVRTTDIFQAPNRFSLFGTFKGPANEFTETTWLNIVGVSSVTSTSPINGTGNANFRASAALADAAINGAKMVPAAMTVQIMNPDALQMTSGIVYIGRAKTVLDLMGDSRTWDNVAQELVAYSAPRLCSAGKLALRGVQVSAVPNNMSVLSDFCPRVSSPSGAQTWTKATYPTDLEGLAPIFIYNPNGVPLQLLVTVEWRMRFDPLNPAYASHVNHTPASEATWAKVISDAEACGHGVEDIADVVADMGGAALAVAPFLM